MFRINTSYSIPSMNRKSTPQIKDFLKDVELSKGPCTGEIYRCSISGRRLNPNRDDVMWLRKPQGSIISVIESTGQSMDEWIIHREPSAGCLGLMNKVARISFSPVGKWELRAAMLEEKKHPFSGQRINTDEDVISTVSGFWHKPRVSKLKTLKEPPSFSNLSREEVQALLPALESGGLKGATFTRCDFSRLDLNSTPLESAEFIQCKFNRTRFQGLNTDISKTSFSNCRMRRVLFKEVRLRDAVLLDNDLYQARFQDCDFGNTRMVRNLLIDIDFEGSNLDGVSFEKCILDQQNLSEEHRALDSIRLHHHKSTNMNTQLGELNALYQYVRNCSDHIHSIQDCIAFHMTERRVETRRALAASIENLSTFFHENSPRRIVSKRNTEQSSFVAFEHISYQKLCDQVENFAHKFSSEWSQISSNEALNQLTYKQLHNKLSAFITNLWCLHSDIRSQHGFFNE